MCVTPSKVNYAYCSGGCADSTSKPILLMTGGSSSSAYTSDCKCCGPTESVKRTVNVDCVERALIGTANPPVTKTQMDYYEPKQCLCDKCE